MGKAGGFITLQKQILSWEWYKDSSTKDLFIHLLLTVNFADSMFQGRVIKRGQIVTSLPTLSTGTGLSIQQIRTALSHLISTGEVTDESYPRYRIITVVKYDEYQKVTDRSTGSQHEVNSMSNSEITGSLTGNQQHHNNINNIYNNKTNNSLVRDVAEEIFSQFWEAYPRKEAKQNAKAAWKKLRLTESEFKKIMSGLEAWKKSDQWNRDGGRYIPMPSTWLNQKRWEDEVSVTVQHEIPRQHSGLPVKKLNADNFEQRDYSGVNDDIMSDLAAQIRKEKEDGLI